jgi:hypothetical protein
MQTVTNLSTQEEITFSDCVSPARAVCYAYYHEQGLAEDFDTMNEVGVDWDAHVTHGKYSVIKGNWCALNRITAKRFEVGDV